MSYLPTKACLKESGIELQGDRNYFFFRKFLFFKYAIFLPNYRIFFVQKRDN